jgi:hypothetical protein
VATNTAVWKGTASGPDSEWQQLLQATARNCRAEQRDSSGAPLTCGQLCSAHRMLAEQRVLDGLLWARRAAERLRAEELHWVPWRSERTLS